MNKGLDVVVLAAGKGTRMRSRRPKVLHPLGGQPVLEHVLRAAEALSPQRIAVVVGHGGEDVQATFSGRALTFVDQGEPLGTGHALLAAREAVTAETLLVLPGDVPLLTSHALERLVTEHVRQQVDVSFLTFSPQEPGRYGRVVREEGRVTRIVEAADATVEERSINEVNSGIFCLRNTPALWEHLAGLSTSNAQGEYYLTDLVPAAQGRCHGVPWPYPDQLRGINDRRELALCEAMLQQRLLANLMEAGVTIINPGDTYVELDVTVGEDTILWPGTLLRGLTRIGRDCTVGPHSELVDTQLADGVWVRFSSLEGAWVGPEARIGPFAHLRPGARIGARARVGNFVEIKEASLGEAAKAGHLAYIGDADIGPGANIGAGTVTCNFDGRRKHRTTIGEGAFVGTHASLVAPVSIGAHAVVAAGSVITEDVPPYALALGRSRQVVKHDWVRGREEP